MIHNSGCQNEMCINVVSLAVSPFLFFGFSSAMFHITACWHLVVSRSHLQLCSCLSCYTCREEIQAIYLSIWSSSMACISERQCMWTRCSDTLPAILQYAQQHQAQHSLPSAAHSLPNQALRQKILALGQMDSGFLMLQT